MSNLGVLGIFGEFLNNIQNNSFDDDWMQHARIISGLHLCDNAIGVKTMVEILDRINANLHNRGVSESAWKLTSVDISSGVEHLVLNMQFTGSRGERAYAICHLRDDEDPEIVEVDADGSIFEYESILSSASATPYKWVHVKDDDAIRQGYVDTIEGDDSTHEGDNSTQWYGRGYILSDTNQYTSSSTQTDCGATTRWEVSYVC